MGNQPSSEKRETTERQAGERYQAEKPDRQARGVTPQGERDKKGNRIAPISGLSHSRPGPADASVSNTSATAQPISSPVQQKTLQQQLQSASPDVASKTKVERSTSRASSRKGTNDSTTASKESSAPVSVPVPSGPMNVPSGSKSKYDDFEDRDAHHHRHYTPVSQLRPPRLPLPIADAVIPESPTLQPVDHGNEDVSIFEDDDPLASTAPHMVRSDSVLSTETQEEEEIRDELQPYAAEATGQMVPTLIEWNQSGDRVYVTGTFANWERKFRLHHNKSSSGMSATISLPPGTHHLKFIVDGDMRTNQDLPTAVDLNNVLVNYIEISVDQMSRSRRESHQKPPKDKQVTASHPQLVPETQEHDASGDENQDYEQPEISLDEEIPLGDFRQLIPHTLLDLELGHDDPRRKLAEQIIGDQPGPPSLPLFLGKSILNGNLPLKDDSSVLTLPNHTVLNHLATSSVRNGVLATSVTTRYKKKYVTTIMYKPVPPRDDSPTHGGHADSQAPPSHS